jgi:hypothetical protein
VALQITTYSFSDFLLILKVCRRAMPPKSRTKPIKRVFPSQHLNQYGLEVMHRDPKTAEVISIQCQFCTYFGKEVDPNQERRRAKTGHPKSWTHNWRTHLYIKHHVGAHASIWCAYQLLSYEDKDAFFKNKTKFNDTMFPHVISNHGHGSTTIQFVIDAPVVDILLGTMFFHPNDIGGSCQTTALKPFIPETPPWEGYRVTLKNEMQFDLAVAFVAGGQSFRQAAQSVMDTKKFTGTSG